jgi:hypothetical protein
VNICELIFRGYKYYFAPSGLGLLLILNAAAGLYPTLGYVAPSGLNPEE